MSAKEARIVRKRYQKAADIYWTKDMERVIRKVRAELNFWRIAGPLCLIGGAVLATLAKVSR